MQDSTPSGTYMQVATSISINSKLWACTCKLAIPQHVLDSYGQTVRHAEWRAQTRTTFIRHLNDKILGSTTTHGNVPIYI
eukprot:185367-Pyramimonas_sp.AAC.1